VLGTLALMFPPILAYPLGVVAAWLGVVLLIRAWKIHSGKNSKAGK